jgi:hypothetical protein
MATAAALADWSVRRRRGVCSVRDSEVGLGAVVWWQRQRDLNRNLLACGTKNARCFLSIAGELFSEKEHRWRAAANSGNYYCRSHVRKRFSAAYGLGV